MKIEYVTPAKCFEFLFIPPPAPEVKYLLLSNISFQHRNTSTGNPSRTMSATRHPHLSQLLSSQLLEVTHQKELCFVLSCPINCQILKSWILKHNVAACIKAVSAARVQIKFVCEGLEHKVGQYRYCTHGNKYYMWLCSTRILNLVLCYTSVHTVEQNIINLLQKQFQMLIL